MRKRNYYTVQRDFIIERRVQKRRLKEIVRGFAASIVAATLPFLELGEKGPLSLSLCPRRLNVRVIHEKIKRDAQRSLLERRSLAR